MRARPLKPEYFTDRRMGAAGPMVGTVYQALWCLADDGHPAVARCTPELVKGSLFVWWPAIGIWEITEALIWLYENSRIRLFRVDDDLFAEIKTSHKYFKTNNASRFRYPRAGEVVTLTLPEDYRRTTVGLHDHYSSLSPLIPQSRSPQKQEQQQEQQPASLRSRRVAGATRVTKSVVKQQQPLPFERTEEAVPGNGAAATKNGGGWTQRFADRWMTEVGAVEYGRLGKALKGLVALHGEAEVEKALEVYLADIGEGTVEMFARDYVLYRGFADQVPGGYTNGGGTLNARTLHAQSWRLGHQGSPR